MGDIKLTQEEQDRLAAAGIGAALFGAAVGGPAGAIIGGIIGLIFGQIKNDEERKKRPQK